MIKLAQKQAQPVETEIDQARMQAVQPGDDAFNPRAHAAACGSSLMRNSAISRASVARSSVRLTTMSTIPCSRKYSARWKPSGSYSRTVCSITRGPAKPISAPGSAI